MESAVERLKTLHDSVLAHLLASEPSLAVATADALAKSLVLAGASEFEDDVHRFILDFFAEATGGNELASQFIQRKALFRNYHALFAWDSRNANTFFALFGPDFKTYAIDRVKEDEGLSAAIRGFLELGSLRNQLVHGNYVTFSLTKTVDEIFALYQSACIFRDAIPTLLMQR